MHIGPLVLKKIIYYYSVYQSTSQNTVSSIHCHCKFIFVALYSLESTPIFSSFYAEIQRIENHSLEENGNIIHLPCDAGFNLLETVQYENLDSQGKWFSHV